jgi:CMP-N-acetylneuraminic acid synthetase
MAIVGLIPARSGSERVPDKNIKELAGHPLIAYSIASALEADIFGKVVVSTDSTEYAEIARSYGARVVMRPDFQWLEYTMRELWMDTMDKPRQFAILRPTSPFRGAHTIRRCYNQWDQTKYQSIRAVSPVKQHPGKQWVLRGDTLYPLLPLGPMDPPWHSSQHTSLPTVYAQNASLEMGDTHVLWDTKTISGWRIQGFLTDRWESFDINEELDFYVAKQAAKHGLATLPRVQRTD